MKKLVAILAASLAMLLCGVKSHAQDIILTTDGQLVMAIVSEISDATVTYKTPDNPNGPDYKLSTSKIQKIRFSNGTEQVFTQPAPQAAQPAQPAQPSAFQPADRQPTYSGAPVGQRTYMEYSRGEFEVAGRELYEGEYRNYFNADEFETVNGAMRQRGAGKGLMIAGGAILGAGLLCFIPGYICWVESVADSYYDLDWTAYAFMWSGVGLISVGGTLMTIGIPIYCVGDSRLRWAASSYNQRNQLALSLGAGRNGAGLFLRF